MIYPVINDHGFEFPDMAELPEVMHEQRFTDSTESNSIVAELQGLFQRKASVNDFDFAVKKLLEHTTTQMPWQDGEHDIINAWRKKLGRQYRFQLANRGWSFHNKDSDNKHFKEMAENGVTFGTSRIVEKIKDVLQPDIDVLLEKEDSISPIGAYDRANPNLGQRGMVVQDLLNSEFKEQGILDAAHTYTGRRIDVKKVTLHISYPSDSHIYQQYRDINLATDKHPNTTNLHIDPKFDLLKGAFYLTDVTDQQGPIWFVKGSNRWKHDEFESVWGRANAVGNYLHDPLHRRAMFRLPKRLRLNYQFGRNLLDGTREQERITDKIVKLTTDQTGNFALFDPGFTMHTGGNVDTGMRINLQLQLK